ncbi:MAG: MinD/ParA family protein [Pseudomonadota bacterium]
MTSLSLVSAAQDANPAAARLITVASGKGGVGKTWFSITLAHALSAARRRVLIFDGDLGLANVDIQLDLTPTRDLGHVLSGRSSMADAITPFRDASAQHAGFDVLAGKSGSGALGNLRRDRIGQLGNELLSVAERYDDVILDLAAGIDSATTQLAGLGGQVFVVLTADPTSLTDAYAFIKVLRTRAPGVDIRIVVNQATNRHEGEATFETIRKSCAAFLKFSPQLAGVIPRDPKVVEAIRHQQPLMGKFPQSSAAKAVAAIVEKRAKERPVRVG